MKKIIIVIVTLLSLTIQAQTNDTIFKYDTKFYDAVDKWVTFSKSQNSDSQMYGFIYIDEMAGFTFRLENSFKIENGKLTPQPSEEAKNVMMITRLERNTRPVHILTETQIKDLNLPNKPDWLSIYKEGENKASYLTKIGYHYNHVGASHNAIAPLLKSYELDPNYDGTSFELGFAYNATNDFLKAIPILKKAIINDKLNHFLIKELGYAYLNSEQLDLADKVYQNGIKVSKDEAIKCEMAVNMAQGYFNAKNKSEFSKWAKIAKENGSKTPQYIKYIEHFEKELEKTED